MLCDLGLLIILWPALFTSFHPRIVTFVQPPPTGLGQCIVHCAALRASQGSLCSPHSDSCSTHPVRLKRGHIFPLIFENINLYSPTERFPCMQHCTVNALLQGPVIPLLLLLLLLSHFSRVRLCGPHRRQPTRLLRPWDSPGKNTGMGCHCLLRSRFYSTVIVPDLIFPASKLACVQLPGNLLKVQL